MKDATIKCLFCGNPANSKEDLFPLWVLRKVNSKELMFRSTESKPAYTTGGSRVKIQSVCNPCNNGWMSLLESTNIPIIGQMLEDAPFTLDISQQIAVVQWATKTSMILDSVEGHKRFYQKAECENFKTGKHPGLYFFVWIGRFARKSLSAFGSSFTFKEINVSPIAHCNVANFIVGHLVIQLLAIRSRGDYENRIPPIQRGANWGELLTQIWPINSKSVNWPTRLSLDLTGDFSYQDLLVRFRVHAKK